MKQIIFLIILCGSTIFNSFFCPVYGQISYEDIFSSVLKTGVNKGFKGQALRGTRNGMGLLYKKGTIYIGDFAKNKRHGLGMLIATNNKEIPNCPETSIFIGRWFEDKQEGNGRCYNANGQLIYEGKFSNGTPIDAYPTPNDSCRSLNMIKTNNGDYLICETFCQIPEGYGVIVFSNGDMWQSRFKDGEQFGIGLYLMTNGNWQTINYDENGNTTIISSSTEYNAMDAARKAYQKECLSEALSSFAQAATIGMNMASGNYKNTSSYSSNYKEESSSNIESNDSNIKSKNYRTIYSNWERRAKQNYESLTNLGYKIKKNDKDEKGNSGQGASPSTYVRQKKLLREAQKEMKRIRQKAQQAGLNIPKSEYEDVSVSY